MSFMNVQTLKSAAILAAADYILTVMGVEDMVAKTTRDITGPIFSMNGVDLPRAFGLVVVALGADTIRNFILRSGMI